MAISNAEIGGGTGVSERWSSALLNVTELGSSLESLQRLLLDKAVYMDEEAFGQASAKSHQTRVIKVSKQVGHTRNPVQFSFLRVSASSWCVHDLLFPRLISWLSQLHSKCQI
jgi:hypothetical protein